MSHKVPRHQKGTREARRNQVKYFIQQINYNNNNMPNIHKHAHTHTYSHRYTKTISHIFYFLLVEVNVVLVVVVMVVLLLLLLSLSNKKKMSPQGIVKQSTNEPKIAIAVTITNIYLWWASQHIHTYILTYTGSFNMEETNNNKNENLIAYIKHIKRGQQQTYKVYAYEKVTYLYILHTH